MKRLIFLLAISLNLYGQPNSQVFLSTPPPLGLAPNQVGVTYVGTQGTTQYYYWVVVRYGIGNAVPGGPASAAKANGTLSGSNFVTISWQGVSGATGYDVLRTTTKSTPVGACACAVATNVSANSTNDQSNSLNSYTVVNVGQGTGIINLDNTSSGGPILQTSINGGPFTPIATGTTVGGTVTSVSFTGGLISVATPTTTPALTVAGTSGGIPYFGSGSTWLSSNALTANLPVIGGGAGTAPSVGTRSGNTTAFVTTTGTQTSGDCVKIDASGNHIANGSGCGSGTGDVVGPGAATDNAVARFDSTTGKLIQNSTVIVDDSGNITTAGGIAAGTSPPSLTPGTGGANAFGEGTVPSVCKAAGVDCLYADSTAHAILASYNNGNYFALSRTIASGAKALATGAISSATCTSAQTDTATGTLTTDAVSASFNGDPTGVTGYVPLTAGMLTIIAYPTADTINFKVCNNTTGSITPGAITLNWRVVR